MNDFRMFFEGVKALNRRHVTPNWHSTYYRYAPHHVEYCKIRIESNPLQGRWSGEVVCEYTMPAEKKELYKQTEGWTAIEVVEKLEDEVREWLGEDVYDGRKESR